MIWKSWYRCRTDQSARSLFTHHSLRLSHVTKAVNLETLCAAHCVPLRQRDANVRDWLRVEPSRCTREGARQRGREGGYRGVSARSDLPAPVFGSADSQWPWTHGGMSAWWTGQVCRQGAGRAGRELRFFWLLSSRRFNVFFGFLSSSRNKANFWLNKVKWRGWKKITGKTQLPPLISSCNKLPHNCWSVLGIK